jgi:hypothetical protein
LSNQLIQYHQEAKNNILGLNFGNNSIDGFALMINCRKGFLTSSIPKLANAGYMAIFHPGNQGVTIHKPNSFDIQSKKKPILQWWRDHNGLWRINPSSDGKQTELDKDKVPCDDHAANVYSLPSTSQSIKFLHAAAGFPVKETWLPAIENGHYSTWPGLTSNPVRKHFPAESVEIQKGHMKKQCQNVRSTKSREQQTVTDKIELRRALTKQNLMVKVIIFFGVLVGEF